MIRREVLELLRDGIARAAVTPPDKWAKYDLAWVKSGTTASDYAKEVGGEPIAVGHFEREGFSYLVTLIVKWKGLVEVTYVDATTGIERPPEMTGDYEFVHHITRVPTETVR